MFKSRSAFTMIELMLAMTFVATLFVVIAMLINYLTATYQKGITLKNVNSAGRHIIADISDAIASSPSRYPRILCRDKGNNNTSYSNKCEDDDAYRLTFYQKYGKVLDKSESKRFDAALYGAFCTGRHSYIWNSGYFDNTNYEVENIHPVTLDGYNNSDGSPKRISLLKVSDPKRNICAGHVDSEYSYRAPTATGSTNALYPKYTLKGDNAFSKKYDQDEQIKKQLSTAYDLIGSSVENVAIYDLRIFRPSIHNTTKQAIYSGTMILATRMGKIDIGGLGEYCKEQSTNLTTEFAYCAINKFNFAARSLGEESTDEWLERNIYYEQENI